MPRVASMDQIATSSRRTPSSCIAEGYDSCTGPLRTVSRKQQAPFDGRHTYLPNFPVITFQSKRLLNFLRWLHETVCTVKRELQISEGKRSSPFYLLNSLDVSVPIPSSVPESFEV